MFSHMTNLLRWLTGCRPRVEWVRTAAEIEKRDGAVRAMLALAFGEAPAMLIEGPHYAVDHGWNERCEVWGRAGRIELELPRHVDPDARTRGRLWSAATGKTTEAAPRGMWAFEEQLKQFAHGVATGEPFRTEAHDAVIDIELAEEALEKLGCSSA
jgi:predicted dehydrogenase